MDSMEIQAGLRRTDRGPVVRLICIPTGEELVVTPARARKLANMLLWAAEAAETDAFLIAWATKMSDGGLDDQQVSLILEDHRRFRKFQQCEDLQLDKEQGTKTAPGEAMPIHGQEGSA